MPTAGWYQFPLQRRWALGNQEDCKGSELVRGKKTFGHDLLNDVGLGATERDLAPERKELFWYRL